MTGWNFDRVIQSIDEVRTNNFTLRVKLFFNCRSYRRVLEHMNTLTPSSRVCWLTNKITKGTHSHVYSVNVLRCVLAHSLASVLRSLRVLRGTLRNFKREVAIAVCKWEAREQVHVLCVRACVQRAKNN